MNEIYENIFSTKTQIIPTEACVPTQRRTVNRLVFMKYGYNRMMNGRAAEESLGTSLQDSLRHSRTDSATITL